MNASQSDPFSHAPRPDSSDCIDLVLDGPGDTTVRPMDASLREQIERGQRVQRAAQRLGRSKEELIREGLDLLFEKYRDQLGDLADPRPSGERPA